MQPQRTGAREEGVRHASYGHQGIEMSRGGVPMIKALWTQDEGKCSISSISSLSLFGEKTFFLESENLAGGTGVIAVLARQPSLGRGEEPPNSEEPHR